MDILLLKFVQKKGEYFAIYTWNSSEFWELLDLCLASEEDFQLCIFPLCDWKLKWVLIKSVIVNYYQ